MSDTDQAITAIARLDLESSMVPNQYEVRGFVAKFKALSGTVNEFLQFSSEYSQRGYLKKFWYSDEARDRMLSCIGVVGELGILANKLLALNVVFAQRIDGQTVAIGGQGTRIEGNQAELLKQSETLAGLQSEINAGVQKHRSDIGELKNGLALASERIDAIESGQALLRNVQERLNRLETLELRVEAIAVAARATERKATFKAGTSMGIALAAFSLAAVSMAMQLGWVY